MHLRAIFLAAALTGVGLPAHATEWLSCLNDAETAGVELLLGSSDTLSVAGIRVTADDKSWASDPAYGAGDLVQVGQAFEDAETIRVDLVDQSGGVNVAQLRIFKARLNAGETIMAGTMVVPERGVWPVICKGE